MNFFKKDNVKAEGKTTSNIETNDEWIWVEPAVCPNCGSNVVKFVDNSCNIQFCHFCGQKLDWSDHPTEKGR